MGGTGPHFAHLGPGLSTNWPVPIALIDYAQPQTRPYFAIKSNAAVIVLGGRHWLMLHAW